MKCQRCGGLVSYEADSRGRFTSCLSCGAEVQLDEQGNPVTPMGYAAEERVRAPFTGQKGRLWREPRKGRKR